MKIDLMSGSRGQLENTYQSNSGITAMVRWPNATIYQCFVDIANTHRDEPALITDDDTLTYGDLWERTRAFATGLADLGVSAGDTVAVWLGNRPEWILTQLAASYLGAAVVVVNTRYRRHELEYMLSDSGATVVVTEDSFLGTDYLEMLADVVPELAEASPKGFDSEDFEDLSEVIAVDPDNTYSAVRSIASVIETGQTSDAPDPATDPDAPVTIFYTSGTTGDPKGCLHDSRSVLNHSYAVGEHFDIEPEDVGLTLLPFCGVMGYNYVFSLLTHGASAVIQPYFDAGRTAKNIATHDVTYLSGTDEMFTRTIDTAAFTAEAADSLRAGAAFFANGYDEATFETIEDAVGFPIVQPYGSSEANSQVFVGDPADSQAQRKRVGGPLVNPNEQDARIVDPETGAELPPGERGELQVRGYNVLEEYLGKPEANEESFDGGWLKTGDLCEHDEQGYFYFHSRIDDALRVRGFLVSPRDIEQAIDDHSDVAQSQVVGATHPRHGEVPAAFVRPAESISAETIHDYLAEHIADYKRPEDVIIIDSFPRAEGPHGEKIQKTKLRDRVADRYTEGEE